MSAGLRVENLRPRYSGKYLFKAFQDSLFRLFLFFSSLISIFDLCTYFAQDLGNNGVPVGQGRFALREECSPLVAGSLTSQTGSNNNYFVLFPRLNRGHAPQAKYHEEL